MSRSYKRPYAPVTLAASAREDKRTASRSVRRAQNRWVRSPKEQDWDAKPIPHFRECPHNEVWGWRREGNQTFQSPSNWELTRYHMMQQGLLPNERNSAWPPLWYQKVMRK